MKTSKKKLYAIVAIVAIVIFAVLAVGVWLRARLANPYLPVKVLEETKGGSIHIYTKWAWEGTKPYYYEVKGDGRLVIGKTYFRVIAPRRGHPRFSLVGVGDGRLVGVVDIDDPEVVLILVDFSTGESWPARGNDQWFEVLSRGERLLKRLQTAHPDKGYQLYQR